MQTITEIHEVTLTYFEWDGPNPHGANFREYQVDWETDCGGRLHGLDEEHPVCGGCGAHIKLPFDVDSIEDWHWDNLGDLPTVFDTFECDLVAEQVAA